MSRPVRLFFGHRDGVFLGQQHEAQNPRGEGQQKSKACLRAPGALRQTALHDPDRQQHCKHPHGLHRHGALRPALWRRGRDDLYRRGDRRCAGLRRDFAQERGQGLRRALCDVLRAHSAGLPLRPHATQFPVFALEKAAGEGVPPERREQNVAGGALDARRRGAAGRQHRQK